MPYQPPCVAQSSHDPRLGHTLEPVVVGRHTRAVPPDVPRSTVMTSRAVFFGGLALGVGLLALAAAQPAPPVGLWVVGGLLTAFFGSSVAVAVVFRLRHPTPEARAAGRAEILARRDAVRGDGGRGSLAHRATKDKAAVLRDGTPGTAVITFIADGGRGNEFRQLVYLELEVTVPGAPAYAVRTGEYLTAASTGTVTPGRELVVKVDPADPQRIAVDWEESLRLRRTR